MTLSKFNSFVALILSTFSFSAFSQSVNSYKNIIHYYNSNEDSRKKSSAIFLSQFVQKSSYFDGAIIKNFDTIFPLMEQLREERRLKKPTKDFIDLWKELVKKYGEPSRGDFKSIPDSSAVDVNFLTNNIEVAYKIRRLTQWGNSIPQDIFDEYLIPYRVGRERIEEGWRGRLYDKYNRFRYKSDSTENDILSFASAIQRDITKNFDNYNPMWSYPFDVPVSKMEQGRLGSCTHLAYYTTSVMRAVGIPATVDFTPLWGNGRTGHMWNVIFLPNGETKAFDAAIYPMGIDMTDRKIAKIYRERNSLVAGYKAPLKTDVPRYLSNAYWEDVTQLYSKTQNINVVVPKYISSIRKYILIGTFNNSTWTPQFYAPVVNGTAVFKNMGINCIYIAMYLDENGDLQCFGDPFTIGSSNKTNYFRPRKRQSEVKLTRKYHETVNVRKMMGSIVGCKFIGSNNQDFTDAKDLFLVVDTPRSFITKTLDNIEKYRYVKFKNQNKRPAYFSEIEFFSGDLKLEVKSKNDINTYDGDLNSYSTVYTMNSIVYDLGKEVAIDKIKYLPRSDTNFILEGNNYQLCYWKNGEWVVIGEIIAEGSELTFPKVPTHAVYLLHNLTQGREERVFIYKNGKQMWF